VDGTLSFFGTYAVSGTDLNLRVEGSSYPNWDETSQKRTNVSVSGDELRYTQPDPPAAEVRRWWLEASQIGRGSSRLSRPRAEAGQALGSQRLVQTSLSPENPAHLRGNCTIDNRPGWQWWMTSCRPHDWAGLINIRGCI